MYIATLTNDNKTIEIHGESEKLKSGNVVKGINTIDSFSFALLPSNAGFNFVSDYKTLVKVYNTNKKRVEFYGRALYSNAVMEESGLIYKEVTCESYFGFLCDSKQRYVAEKNWTVEALMKHIVDEHNSQVEEHKQFTVGEVTVTDPNNNLYLGIQRENSWKTITDKLIGKLGGEIRFRVEGNINYIDYLEQIGETRATTIELSKNMKTITRECDASSFISRLVPLGCKLKDDNEKETEERLGIATVNNGVEYIEDERAREMYGIRVETVEFDDITTASALLTRGRTYLAENNRVQVKFSVKALDLSLLGLDIDDFETHNYHPIKNSLLAVDDVARIIKKNINVCNEVESTIEIGNSFKTLIEIQQEQAERAVLDMTNALKNEVNKLRQETNTSVESLQQTVIEQNTLITSNCEEIIMSALESYVQTGNLEEYKEVISSQLQLLANEITMKFTTTTTQLELVNGMVSSKLSQYEKHISFSENGICIHDANGAQVMELWLDSGLIKFVRGGQTFGRWDGEDFYTSNIVVEVTKRVQLGAYAFVPRRNNHMSLLLVE